MSADPLKLISAERTALVLDHPFFGSLALRLTPVEVGPEVTNTMATDGSSLFYCTDFVLSLKPGELRGLIAHEVMHCAMLHHTRRGAREGKRWNYAADFAINPLLIESGFILPAGGCVDAKFKGMSAEQIYAALPASPEGSKGKGKGKDNADGKGSKAGAPGAPGNQPGTPDASAPGDELKNLPGAVLDAVDAAQAGPEWQVAVKQAVNTARMMGRLPAHLAAAIAEQTAPVVDWRALLRRFVQQCASADYSYNRPNRRYISAGVFLPELRSESMPPVVLVDDTSGSVTAAQQAAFRAEAQEIIDECKPEATFVIYCSSKVHHVDRFDRGEPLTMARHGTGGTDFRPAFTYVSDNGITPACLIYLTDGEGKYPDTAPEYPVLWAMTSPKVPPWGERVQLGTEVER